VGAVALVGLVVGGWYLAHSRWLSARVVTVVGSTHTPTAEIEQVAGLADHPPLVDVDPGAAAARLEQLPWVERATVHREWPDGVKVTVVEATPAAAVALPHAAQNAKGASAARSTATAGATSSGWALVDRSGKVLTDQATPPANLVRLEVPARPGAPGSWLGSAADPGLDVVSSLPRAFSAQVTAVVVGHGGQVTLDLTTPVTVDLGTTTQLPQKYEAVAAVLAGAKLTAGDVINVSVPDSVTVGPA
jgi:cell division protein FtsQ